MPAERVMTAFEAVSSHRLRPSNLDGMATLRRVFTYARWKAVFDFLMALVLSVLALPVILLAALLVKLTSRGPVFYSQTRLGIAGRPYRIYKLRTMRHNCERESGAKWAAVRDSRITPIGRLLRVTHIDELPQLFNVLKGEMSLVGPRPERPEFVPELEQAIGRYRERLKVRPGVTGLAQIQLPADVDHDSVRRKLIYDLHYINHLSLWLDLRIIASTALKMAHVPFVFSEKVLRLPGRSIVEGSARPAIRHRIKERAPAAVLQPEIA